jgi:hypothetical protein
MKINFGTILIWDKYKVIATEHTKRWNKRFIGKVGVCRVISAIRGAALTFNTHTEVIPFDSLETLA